MVMIRLAWNLLEDVGYIDGWGVWSEVEVAGDLKTRFRATKREGILSLDVDGGILNTNS